MPELLAYLRANGFKTWIVSGGGIEFVRAWSEKACGIPPEQVIGSSVKTRYEVRNGVPMLVRLPEINFIDDKAGKPVGINQHIGRRPIAALAPTTAVPVGGDPRRKRSTTPSSRPRSPASAAGSIRLEVETEVERGREKASGTCYVVELSAESRLGSRAPGLKGVFWRASL